MPFSPLQGAFSSGAYGSALPFTQMGSGSNIPGTSSMADVLERLRMPMAGTSQTDPSSAYAPAQPPVPASPRPTGMFGAPQSLSPVSSQISDPAAPQLGPVAQPNVQAPQIHPGFFQSGGLGSKLLHGLGEFALNYQASQGDPRALMVLRQRMEQQVYQRDRTDAQSDAARQFQQQLTLEQYRRSTPNDEFSHYLDAGGFSPEQRQQLYRQRATSMANPIEWITADNGNGTKTVMPRPRFGPNDMSSGSNSMSGPPGEAIAALRANPALAPQFDAKYGIGAHRDYLGVNAYSGGAGSATPQTFR